MCGIIGIIGTDPVAQELYDGLTLLQHRGQDAAGIVTSDGKKLHLRRHNGLVRDVFTERHMQMLQGLMGIGHVRYPTAGSSSSAEAQPFYVNSPFGISLGHNGNLVNASELKRQLFEQDRRHINTESDSEILLNIFAQELLSTLLDQKTYKVTPDHIFHAVRQVHKRCQGAYSVVGMITRDGLFGFRDPHGIRPLIYGCREGKNGMEYMLASESVALVTQGFEIIRDIKPGEAIYIDAEHTVHTQQCAENPIYNNCMFEYVYFSRPDSILDDVFVHKARMRMGEYLAKKIRREYSHLKFDVVVPIPDTSRTSALELATALGVRYREGLMKNRYIGRTFIMPGQTERKKSVRLKLNPIELELYNKDVLLVDDSIVRGTTSREIVQMVRSVGAKSVTFASASPPVRYQNVYGIDMPATNELIAHNRSTAEICQEIAADNLIYQDLGDLTASVQHGNTDLTAFECSVFNNEYVTGLPEGYLKDVENKRNEAAKTKREAPNHAAIDISHNR